MITVTRKSFFYFPFRGRYVVMVASCDCLQGKTDWLRNHENFSVSFKLISLF